MKKNEQATSAPAALDKYFTRNTIGISSTEFLWGLGLPVIVESTFLQLFLRRLGASGFLIGLVPAIFFFGISLFGLVSGYLTSHLASKRRAVVLTHVFGSIPFLVLGVVLPFTGFGKTTIALFFVFYALFSAIIGLLVPTWQNYIVKIFSERRAVQGLSVMWIVQNIGKIISSFVIAKIVEEMAITSESSSLLFILVGAVCFIGSFMFLITREGEVQAENSEREPSFFRHFLKTSGTILRNRQFIYYLVSDIETYAVMGTIAFYAIFATEECGVSSAAAAGIFVAVFYMGGFISNFIFGTLNLLPLKLKFGVTKVCALAALLLLIVFQQFWIFLLVSFLLGLARANRSLLYPVAVRRLAFGRDATDYYALAYIIMLPLSVGLPLFNGWLLDSLEGYGPLSFRIVFGIMAVMVGVSVIFLAKVQFPQNQPVEEGDSHGNT